MKRMSQMRNGERGRVLSLWPGCAAEQRLRELGLREGAEVCCVGQSPLSDPKAYFISGAVIALRQKDAAYILVEIEKAD